MQNIPPRKYLQHLQHGKQNKPSTESDNPSETEEAFSFEQILVPIMAKQEETTSNQVPFFQKKLSFPEQKEAKSLAMLDYYAVERAYHQFHSSISAYPIITLSEELSSALNNFGVALQGTYKLLFLVPKKPLPPQKQALRDLILYNYISNQSEN